MRQCLIISAYFPPSTLAGVHRARHLAKHLDAYNWKPTILCVHERYHEERLDPELGALVPSDVELIKVRALMPRLTRAFGIGDIGLRAFTQIHSKCHQLLKERDYSAVFITGGPFYPMLLAGGLRKKFHMPVVLDFQDPWVSSWGAKQSRYSKAGLSNRLATWLEPLAVRNSSFVTSVSATQNEEMSNRYSWLDSSAMAAVPIGGDPEDFEILRSRGKRGLDGIIDEQYKNLSYVGTLLPEATPLMMALFRALSRLRETLPESCERLRLNFVGTSNQPNTTDEYRVMPLARQAGVDDLVDEIPQRIPFLDALNILAKSHAILLVGSTENHYTASKIYPGLMAGRPFLSLFNQRSSAHQILSAAGGGLAFSFKDERELADLEPVLTDGLETLITRPATLGKVNPEAYASCTASAVTEQFARILDLVSRRP